ncbi:hypothetical protein ACFZCK_23290 [Kitasatospora purpeofusca]|uniref:hypothetical protein n=1 Tax=Kitasatospora purpeofusca TaxID=67352 RepID=UPI0036E6D22D
MNKFDRERAHREADDLSHLKDEVDEKNTGILDSVRHDGSRGRRHTAQADEAVAPAAGRDEGDGTRGG